VQKKAVLPGITYLSMRWQPLFPRRPGIFSYTTTKAWILAGVSWTSCWSPVLNCIIDFKMSQMEFILCQSP